MSRVFSVAALPGLVLAALVCTSPTAAPAADSPMQMPQYHRTSYRGAPDLGLALALVIGGGGPDNFDAGRLVGTLAGSSTQAEVKKLTAQFGAGNVASFLATFTYAIDDTLRLVEANHVALPAKPTPDPANGPELAASLYAAGLLPDGKYDVGYMIEHVISHDLHVALMHDIDGNPKYGPKANANFHVILTQAVLDLRDEYGL